MNIAEEHFRKLSKSDSFKKIDTVLESEQQKDKMTNDGGGENDKYEVGSNLGLIAATGGSCTY